MISIFGQWGKVCFTQDFHKMEKLKFVYDCVTENWKELIKIQINNFVSDVLCNGHSIIDFVFISYLYKDHYSDLYY